MAEMAEMTEMTHPVSIHKGMGIWVGMAMTAEMSGSTRCTRYTLTNFYDIYSVWGLERQS